MAQPTFIVRPTAISARSVTFELKSIYEFRLPTEAAFGAWAVVAMLDEVRKRSSTRWETLVGTHPELDEALREQRSLGPSQVSAIANRWVSSWTLSNEGTYVAGVAGVDVPPGQEESLCATAELVLAHDAPNAFLESVPRDAWIHCFIHAPEVATVTAPSRPAASELKYLVVCDRDETLTEGRWARTPLGGYVWGLDLDPGRRARQWAAVAVRNAEVPEQRGHGSASEGWVDKVGDLESVQAFVRAQPGFVEDDVPEAHGQKTVGDGQTAVVGNEGTATAGADGVATAGDYGTAIVGLRGTATVGRSGSARAGMKGTAIAGDRGKAEAGHMGRATAGEQGKARAGKRGVAEAGVGGHVAAGEGGTLRLKRANGSWAEIAVGGAIAADILHAFEEEGSSTLQWNEKPGWVPRKSLWW